MLYPGHNPTDETFDNTWEIFLWGEYAIHPMVDFDLSVPRSWFEYEDEQYSESRLLADQITLPDDQRRESTKHPNCNKELWYSQNEMDRFEEMKDPEWTVKDLSMNVYHSDNFVSNRKVIENNDGRLI